MLSPCLCGRLRRASRKITRHYDEALAPVGLTIMQFGALRWITRLGAPSVTELAEATGHERTAMWRGLQPLMARGLVRTAEGEGAAGVLQLTAKGTQTLKRATPLWADAQDKIAGAMGAKMDALMSALEEVEHAV